MFVRRTCEDSEIRLESFRKLGDVFIYRLWDPSVLCCRIDGVLGLRTGVRRRRRRGEDAARAEPAQVAVPAPCRELLLVKWGSGQPEHYAFARAPRRAPDVAAAAAAAAAGPRHGQTGSSGF